MILHDVTWNKEIFYVEVTNFDTKTCDMAKHNELTHKN